MDHFHYQDGVLLAEDVAVDAIAKAVGTPFYCYSQATFTRHYTVFRDSFPGMDIRICYAMKANSNLALLKIIASLGGGADVVSEGEIRLARAAGIPANRIVFSGVGKTREEMAYALTEGIFQFNIESAEELSLLAEVAAGLGKRAPIAVRVNPDIEAGTHAKISTGGRETKFGVAMSHAAEVYARAAALPSIDVRGVSVHIGSQLTTLAPFRKAFELLREFVEDLRQRGIAIHTIDLGGGLGIPYGEANPPPLPMAYGEIVREVMKGEKATLIFEPGRMLVGNAGILVTRVLYIKQGEDRRFVIIDAGMNDLMRPALYDAYHAIVPVMMQEGGATEEVDIVGPVCETSDIFASQRLMKVPRAGDLLAFRTAGAYGASMGNSYNARPRAAEVLVNGKQYAVTRARETYAEMVGQYQLPGWL